MLPRAAIPMELVSRIEALRILLFWYDIILRPGKMASARLPPTVPTDKKIAPLLPAAVDHLARTTSSVKSTTRSSKKIAVPDAVKLLMNDMLVVASFSCAVSSSQELLSDLERTQLDTWDKEIKRRRDKCRLQRESARSRVRALHAARKRREKQHRLRKLAHGARPVLAVGGGENEQGIAKSPVTTGIILKRRDAGTLVKREAAVWRHVPQPGCIPRRPASASRRRTSRDSRRNSLKYKLTRRKRPSSAVQGPLMSPVNTLVGGRKGIQIDTNALNSSATSVTAPTQTTKEESTTLVQLDSPDSHSGVQGNSAECGVSGGQGSSHNLFGNSGQEHEFGTMRGSREADHISNVDAWSGEAESDTQGCYQVHGTHRILKSNIDDSFLAHQATIEIPLGEQDEATQASPVNIFLDPSHSLRQKSIASPPQLKFKRNKVEPKQLHVAGSGAIVAMARRSKKPPSNYMKQASPGLPGWIGPAGSSLCRHNGTSSKSEFSFCAPNLSVPLLSRSNTRGYRQSSKSKADKYTEKLKRKLSAAEAWQAETEFLLKRVDEIRLKQGLTLKLEQDVRKGKDRDRERAIWKELMKRQSKAISSSK